MIGDVLYKLTRKVVPQAAYAALSRSPLGRGRAYYQPVTYRAIHEFYRGKGVNVQGKKVLEVGPGSQLFTAFFFLSDGAEEVLVADPKVDPASAMEQLRSFQKGFGGALSDDALSRLRFFTDTSAIPSEYDGRIDLICSHNVLEHVSDLEAFFRDTSRLLAPRGESCHRVDLTDHTYHVLGKYPRLVGFATRRSLYHLRYSDRIFALLSDSKTYMNRRLLPVYLAIFRQLGLKVTALEREPFPDTPIHPDLLRGVSWDPGDLRVSAFFVRLTK